MLKIKDNKFQVSTAELNLRKRTFEGQEIVSLQFQINFYPKQVNEEIVSGTVEVVVDIDDFKELNDINNQTYKGPGKVQASVQINSVWETETYYDFTLTLGMRKKNQIEVTLVEKSNTVSFKLPVTIISLYMVNPKEEYLSDDYYKIPIRKTINGKEIVKYIVKGE